MNRGRVHDLNIPTGVNSLDTTNMPLSESLTRQGILHNYEPATSLHNTSHYVTFEWYVVDTEDDSEDNCERANPPSNNEVINQKANLRRPQRKIFPPHIFDPRRVPKSNWKSDMVENMPNVVTEYKITQGGF